MEKRKRKENKLKGKREIEKESRKQSDAEKREQ